MYSPRHSSPTMRRESPTRLAIWANGGRGVRSSIRRARRIFRGSLPRRSGPIWVRYFPLRSLRTVSRETPARAAITASLSRSCRASSFTICATTCGGSPLRPEFSRPMGRDLEDFGNPGETGRRPLAICGERVIVCGSGKTGASIVAVEIESVRRRCASPVRAARQPVCLRGPLAHGLFREVPNHEASAPRQHAGSDRTPRIRRGRSFPRLESDGASKSHVEATPPRSNTWSDSSGIRSRPRT